MIKTKLILLTGLIALIIFTLSAGSLALFSGEAVSQGNTINAGTLFIGKDDGCKGVLGEFVSLNDMLPGAEPQKLKIKVKNLGTMTAYINGLSVNITESNGKFLANALRTKCVNSGGNVLYRGSLLALDGNVIPLEREIVLEPDQATELEFFIQLDERAGNWYKGKGVEFSITVYAGQKPGQAVGERVHLAEGGNVQAVLDGAEPGDVILIPAGSYGNLEIKPGVAVKAKDVVFDTVVGGFTVRAGGSGKGPATGGQGGNLQGNATLIQGFAINGTGVKVKPGRECKILDNIFNAAGNPVIVNGSGKALLTRNDFTGCSSKTEPDQGAGGPFTCSSSGGQVEARYNLGVDLDPKEHAL
ncbi:hypothetical protein IT084_09745 [Desulfallas sp. Bu1-1]|uniref:hypothetical protein n=1 Tax=Desulfallas sp. Bu1-1 TaxID=2787620 RepID=UPI00189EDD3E|nr:hypothetical protein [Desulfallas sp. Bu1-1]MBF7083256.1 hypothetical protein [Desulfallas sp. Bu1-1]